MTRAVAAAVLLASCGPGCGTDVSLGGTPGAGTADAGTLDLALDCQPCLEQVDCASTQVCGIFSGDSFCATTCSNGAACDPDEACSAITTVGGAGIMACVPKGGLCPVATGPVAEGGALDRCSGLNGPLVTSACHSCGKYSSDCQPNGCYGGWWCNTATRKCQRPPKTCP